MKTKKKTSISKFIDCNYYLMDVINNPEQPELNLPANQTYELELTYPLSKPYPKFKIHTNKGMKLPKLLKKIGNAYSKVYTTPEKFGVWGHGIEDLCIEGIKIDNKNKKIKLLMGS
jgi:hypothetical protein